MTAGVSTRSRRPRGPGRRHRARSAALPALRIGADLICGLLLARVAGARILITEIHYHPSGTAVEEAALEFVEIMNDEPLPFDVSCIQPDFDGNPDCLPNRFYAYGVIARLALLAAAVELERMEQALEAPEHAPAPAAWVARA